MTDSRISRRRFTQAAATGTLLGLSPRLAHAEPHDDASTNKKGCCFVARPDNGWKHRVEQLRPSWMYSWGAKRPEGLPAGVEFVPMLWGNAKAEGQQRRIDDLKQRAAAGEFGHLLGFNEPDQHEQSNMTVDRVVELWPDLMDVGVPLVSPGCVHPDRVWMKEFMEQVDRKDLRVDAIAVHSYGGPSVKHLVNRLRKVHEMFERPIWITEFAVGDWEAKTPRENRHRPKRVAEFLRGLLPVLEDLPFVHRYAWFAGSPSSGPLGTSALFDKDGRLTKLGRIYRSHSA